MKTKRYLTTLVALPMLLSASPVLAQSEPGFDTPAACKTAAASTGSDMQNMAMGKMGSMDKAHQAMMNGMGTMNTKMNEGMMASDVDIAFVCGMLPHHQGAINMARAELQYGKDAWTKKLAQNIIDAQLREIGEIKDWLSKHAK